MKNHNLFFGLNITLSCILISCSSTPHSKTILENEYQIGSKTISPFYIDLGKKGYIINCSNESTGDSYDACSYFFNNEDSLLSTYKNDSNYIPSILFRHNIYARRHSKFKLLNLSQRNFILNDEILNLKELFSIPDKAEYVLGGNGKNCWWIADDSLFCSSGRKIYWKKFYPEIPYSIDYNNELILINKQNITFIADERGYKSFKYTLPENSILKKHYSGITIYNLNKQFLIFSTKRAYSKIYCIALDSSKLLWESKEIPVFYQMGKYTSLTNPIVPSTYLDYTLIANQNNIYIFKNDVGLVKSYKLKDDEKAINYFMRNNKFYIVTANGELHIYNPEDLL